VSEAISRRSLIGAAATATVAGSAAATLLQRSGLEEYDRRGGFGLVVAQHDLRVDHVRLADVVNEVASAGGIAPFVAVGMSVPGATDPAVYDACMMRTRGADGWSDWTTVPFAPEEAPEGPEAEGTHRFASQPYWVGFADAIEVDLPEGLADSVAVHFVRETPVILDHHSDTVPAAKTLAERPAIRGRTAWNARSPKVAMTYASKLSMAVVHHTVSRNGYSAGEVPGILLAIQRYHMDVNSWNDIAYNFIIDRFGRVWEARAGGVRKLAIGGHAAGFNTGTTGICALGDYHYVSGYTNGVQPSAAMVAAYESLLAWKLGIHGVDPTGSVRYTAGYGSKSSKYPAGTTGTFPRVVGHTDVGSTACPGSLLHPKIPAMRSAAKAKQGGFRDVLLDAYYAPAITWMVTSKMTPGPDQRRYFRPNQVVTRKLMALWLWKLMDKPKGYPAHGFTDIPSGANYDRAVRWLKAEGITDGMGGPGKFSPNAPVTRAQMAAFLWRLAGKRTGYGPHGFVDVPTRSYYNRAVRWLKANRITTGVGGSNRYQPHTDITRAELATFLFRLAGRRVAWTPEARRPKSSTMRF
jgi:hypothetical protein